MLIKFEHRRNGNTSTFSNIEYDVKTAEYEYPIYSPYHCYMLSGYDLVYVDTIKYKSEDCYIYHIRDFMEKHKIEMRRLIIRKLLEINKQ